jgi:1-acyl-sn-glycerol-3-phosphate acyltransferase
MPTKYFLHIRACWRVLRLGLHLLNGSATVLLLFPWLSRGWRQALKKHWSRQLIGMLGMKLKVHGRNEGAMHVANHVSWLDIFIINAVLPSAFIAKEEVRQWPLIGWLCANTETLFIRRRSHRAAHGMASELSARLNDGVDAVGFPEGTSSDGQQVLPFHGAMLQPAIDAGMAIQPLALRYAKPCGTLALEPAYYGDISLGQSIWRIAMTGELIASVTFMPARATEGCDRRELARLLRNDIANTLAGSGALSNSGTVTVAGLLPHCTSSSCPSKCSTMAVQLSTQSPQLM